MAIEGQTALASSQEIVAVARDSVANLVNRLREKGSDPRRVEPDAWESRCPGHRGREQALVITRNQFGDVAFSCRAQECDPRNILSAVDLSITRLYAGTPNWVLKKLSERPIVASSYLPANLQARLDRNGQPRESLPPSRPAMLEPTPARASTVEPEPTASAAESSQPTQAELPVDADTAASARWPKSPQWLTDELRRIAPQLRMHGVNLTFGRTHQGRFISLESSACKPCKNGDTPNSKL
jgi:hypothetical protein